MPDFGAPAVRPVQFDPAAGMQRLSDVVNLKRSQQALQSGALEIQQQQQNLGLGAANLQSAQQQMQERQLLQSAMQSGKDPDGNSIKSEDGKIDPVAMGTFANKYMPLTGQAVQQSIIQTLDNRVKLNDSVRGLNQEYRNDLSGIVRSAIGTKQTPEQIGSALDAYGQKNPDATPAISRAKALVQNLNQNMPLAQRDQALQHLAMEFQPAGTTERAQAPAIGTITGPGGGMQAVQTNPNSPIPMGKVGPEVQQGMSPQLVMDAAGNPHFVTGAGGGGSGNGGQGWTNRPGAEAQANAAQEMTSHFSALNDSAKSLPLVNSLTHTIEGLAPSAYTGVGGDKRQYLAGLARSLGVNLTGDSQTDTNLLNKAMSQLNMSSPAATDAARTLVEAGQPNSKMDPDAIKEAAGTVASQVKMNVAERDFLNSTRFKNGGSGDAQTYQQARQWFENNADPRIWQYEQMRKNSPAAAKKFISRQPDASDLANKADILQQAGFFK